MKVFISWSGVRSQKVAELLNDWMQCVIQAVNPWMSSKDIDRGSLWFSEINDQLSDTNVGIICLTQENKNKPWILFEAGALAKGINSSRVCTFLIDLQSSDVGNPLAQFNHTFPERESVLGLARTINASLKEKALKESILEKVFDTYWSKFKSDFEKIISETPDEEVVSERTENEILREILDSTRGTDRRLRALENKNNRGELIKEESQNTLESIKQNKSVSLQMLRSKVKNLLSYGFTAEEIFQELSMYNCTLNTINKLIDTIENSSKI
ncbi:TIR domain-containing protein [Psychrilyobacter atlanticus]|uniref:TIR domain-containing protein n=1 Tax=Psychrilyobacter atlanticus TaxID=271091 RepID=UPI00040681C7|nr:TIR domain-containing protein [Psychrilyobacter atlanticus]